MTFPHQITLRSAIADLKEVVTRLHADNTDPVRLLAQIEALGHDIELKANALIIDATPDTEHAVVASETVAASETVVIQPILNQSFLPNN